MIVINMIDMAFLRIRRNHQERNPWSITEKIEILDGAGIEITTTFQSFITCS
ncbi:MAG: hypothetical protein QX198_08840 [Methylococcaceae bacterium]